MSLVPKQIQRSSGAQIVRLIRNECSMNDFFDLRIIQ